MRAEFPDGKASLRIEPGPCAVSATTGVSGEQCAIHRAFKARQQAAFDAERERWRSGEREDDGTADLAVDGAGVASLQANSTPPGLRRHQLAGCRQRVELHSRVGARAGPVLP